MKDFVKRMIDEHCELVKRIDSFHHYVYNDKSDADDKVEFANKCIQLAAMKKYEEALRARLENADIVCDGREYFERVTNKTKDDNPEQCKKDKNINTNKDITDVYKNVINGK